MAKFQIEITQVKEGGGCATNIFWAIITFIACMLIISQCGK